MMGREAGGARAGRLAEKTVGAAALAGLHRQLLGTACLLAPPAGQQPWEAKAKRGLDASACQCAPAASRAAAAPANQAGTSRSTASLCLSSADRVDNSVPAAAAAAPAAGGRGGGPAEAAMDVSSDEEERRGGRGGRDEREERGRGGRGERERESREEREERRKREEIREERRRWAVGPGCGLRQA